MSSVSLRRLSSVASASNRSATALTIPATPVGLDPRSSSWMKLSSRSLFTTSAFASSFAASEGAATVKTILCPGATASGAGAHRNPRSAPTESPREPCSCTPPAEESVKVGSNSATLKANVPGRTCPLIRKERSAAESAGSSRDRYNRRSRTTDSNTADVSSRSVHPDEIRSCPVQSGPSSRLRGSGTSIQIVARAVYSEPR